MDPSPCVSLSNDVAPETLESEASVPATIFPVAEPPPVVAPAPPVKCTLKLRLIRPSFIQPAVVAPAAPRAVSPVPVEDSPHSLVRTGDVRVSARIASVSYRSTQHDNSDEGSEEEDAPTQQPHIRKAAAMTDNQAMAANLASLLRLQQRFESSAASSAFSGAPYKRSREVQLQTPSRPSANVKRRRSDTVEEDDSDDSEREEERVHAQLVKAEPRLQRMFDIVELGVIQRKASGQRAATRFLYGSRHAGVGSNAISSLATAEMSVPYQLSDGPRLQCACCVKSQRAYLTDIADEVVALVSVLEKPAYVATDGTEADSGVVAAVVAAWGGRGHAALTRASPGTGTSANASSNTGSSGGGGVVVDEAVNKRIVERLVDAAFDREGSFHYDAERRTIYVLVCVPWECRLPPPPPQPQSRASKGRPSSKAKAGATGGSASASSGTSALSASPALADGAGATGAEAGVAAVLNAPARVPSLRAATLSTGASNGALLGGAGGVDGSVGQSSSFAGSARSTRIVFVDIESVVPLADEALVHAEEEEEEAQVGLPANSGCTIALPPSGCEDASAALPTGVDPADTPLAVFDDAVPVPTPPPHPTASPSASLSTALVAGPRRKSQRVTKSCSHQFTEEDAFSHLIRIGYTAPCYVEDIPARGRCVFAGGYIPRGAFVAEYSGQLIDAGEHARREAMYGCGDFGSYVFHVLHAGAMHYVDATAERKAYGVGRLINHSRKNPNVAPRKLIVDGVPRLAFIARRDITYGDELLYDYGERDKVALQAFGWMDKT